MGLDQNKLDEKTRKFVYEFIENNGGIEMAKKASRKISTKRFRHEPEVNDLGGNRGQHTTRGPPPQPRTISRAGPTQRKTYITFLVFQA